MDALTAMQAMDHLGLQRWWAVPPTWVTEVGGGLHVCTSPPVVEWLISALVLDVMSARNRYGQTPLHVHASRGANDICEWYVGACPALLEARDLEGHTPFHCVRTPTVASACLASLARLANSAALHAVATTSLNTCLHAACLAGVLPVVQLRGQFQSCVRASMSEL